MRSKTAQQTSVQSAPSKPIFSGHESFQCRHLWLKKGYDYVKKKKSFNNEDSVVSLGVGKNMVSSIRFWMKSFNLLTADDKLTDFAHQIFADNGFDPYLEDEATIWLLHYHLVKKGYASTYSILFNELRKEKVEFTKDNFVGLIKRKAESDKYYQVNEKTLLDDFAVFTKMYLRSETQTKDKEDSFTGILTELDLIKTFSRGKEDFYVIELTERNEIPDDIVLYAILDNEVFESSINITSIEMNINSVGSIFAINRSGLITKIENLTKKYSYIVYKDQAGVKELQFKKKPLATSILEKYYAN